MPAVGIVKDLNVCLLVQLCLKLFRVQLAPLVHLCTGWMSTQSICTCCSTGATALLYIACGSCSTLNIYLVLYIYRHRQEKREATRLRKFLSHTEAYNFAKRHPLA